MKLLILICVIVCIVRSNTFEVRKGTVASTILLNASKRTIFAGQGFDTSKSSNRKHMRVDKDDSIDQLESAVKYKKPVHKIRYDTYRNKKDLIDELEIPRKYSLNANYIKKTVENAENAWTVQFKRNLLNTEAKDDKYSEKNNIYEDYVVHSTEKRSYGLSANYKKASPVAVTAEIKSFSPAAAQVSNVESNKPKRSYGLSANYNKASPVAVNSVPNKTASNIVKESRVKNQLFAALKFILAKIKILIPIMNITFIVSKRNYANFLATIQFSEPSDTIWRSLKRRQANVFRT